MEKAINIVLAEMFEDVGNSLQYQGEAWVKVRSYLHVAEVLRALAEPADVLVKEGRIDDVEGVGPAISKKIREYLADGTFPLLKRLDEQIPSGVRAMLRAGVAPSLAHHLVGEGYDTLEKLEEALDGHALEESSVPTKLRARLRDYLSRRSSS